MKISLSDNRATLGKIPQGDKNAWRVFNGSFVVAELTAVELMERIGAGWAYTAVHERYRKKENFISAQHVALDFDTEDSRSTIETLAADPFIANHASFIHTTPSHTAERPRARVVFVLDKAIKRADKYTLLAQALVHRFGMADGACKDPARFFYGAMGCETQWLGNVLTVQVAAEELVWPYQAALVRVKGTAVVTVAREILPAHGVDEALLRYHSDKLLQRVENAPDGEKHTTLRDTAITFGGYVASGYYHRGDVEMWLQAAIRANGGKVADLDHAYKTIADSLLYGMARPLTFENRQAVRDNDDLGAVHPPLTELQKKQIAVILDRCEVAAYNAGMTAVHRAMWARHGFSDALVDYLGFGYCEKRIDENTGEILASNALTVPFTDPITGNLVNVEYRQPDGRFSYESNYPSLYFVPDSDKHQHTVVLPDTVTAVDTYLHALVPGCTVAGLPHMPLSAATLDCVTTERITVVLEPETPVKGVKHLRERARFVRLPIPIKRAVKMGMGEQMFRQYLEQARAWTCQ